MITYLRTDLFSSPAQTLVNAVNTVGVMGKGIAKTFKDRYPEMFDLYAEHCRRGELKIGNLMLWRGPEKWVLNFPTKTTWKLPSKLEYIEGGLRRFVEVYDALGIESVSFPPLGCGNGNLEWSEVRPLMERYLGDLPIPILIHDRHVPQPFVPEHLENAGSRRPWTLEGFRHDLLALLDRGEPAFDWASVPQEQMDDAISDAWAALRGGLLTRGVPDNSGADPVGAAIFQVLGQLPYVQRAEIQGAAGRREIGEALFFIPSSPGPQAPLVERANQLSLWP